MSEANTPAPASEAPAAVVTPAAEGSPLGVVPAAAEEAPAETPAGEGEGTHEGDVPSPEGEKPAEGEGETLKEDEEPLTEEPAPLTPESYQFQLPNGVSVDEAALTTLKQTLADAKVPVEVGQSLIDMHVAELTKSAEAFAANQKAAWEGTLTEWKTAIDADPELGGDKKAHVTSTIAQALDEYGTPETRQAFDLTGSGWNPAVIKFVYRMAEALREGSVLPAPGPSSNRTKTPGQVLYENDGQGPNAPAS